MIKASGKIAYLDGIRGVAALCVFFHHFLLTFYSAYYTFDVKTIHLQNLEINFGKSIFSVFVNGPFCVSIFFVLSGFVLSRKYFETNDFESIKSAAHRRYLRLYIPVAAVTIISFVLMKFHLYFNVPASLITKSGWLGCFWNFTDLWPKLIHCLGTGTMFQADASFDNSLWTMTYELYGSFFVFAFLALTHNIRNKFVILAMVFLLLSLLNDRGTYTTFVFGISLNFVEKAISLWNKYFRGILSGFFLILGLVLGSFPAVPQIQNTLFEHWPPFIMQYSEWFMTYGALFFVLAFVFSRGLQNLIGLGFCRFLGFISFSFYLLHPIILGSFTSYFFIKINEHLNYHKSVVIVFMATIIISFFLSWVMAKYVDAYGMKISKYVYEKWFKYSIKKE